MAPLRASFQNKQTIHFIFCLHGGFNPQSFWSFFVRTYLELFWNILYAPLSALSWNTEIWRTCKFITDPFSIHCPSVLCDLQFYGLSVANFIQLFTTGVATILVWRAAETAAKNLAGTKLCPKRAWWAKFNLSKTNNSPF